MSVLDIDTPHGPARAHLQPADEPRGRARPRPRRRRRRRPRATSSRRPTAASTPASPSRWSSSPTAWRAASPRLPRRSSTPRGSRSSSARAATLPAAARAAAARPARASPAAPPRRPARPACSASPSRCTRPGGPEKTRLDELEAVTVPVLIVQGESRPVRHAARGPRPHGRAGQGQPQPAAATAAGACARPCATGLLSACEEGAPRGARRARARSRARAGRAGRGAPAPQQLPRRGGARYAARPGAARPHGRRRAARLRIEFERYPRRDRSRPSLGTMLAVEGGPGLLHDRQPRRTTSSSLGPLRGRRDLLLVDLRGTGRSGALDCPALRRTVDALRRRAPGAAPRSSARGATSTARARAVDDLAAVLDALGIAAGRPLRRLLRHLRRPGVRRPPPGPAALARARRRLSAARHRPGVRRPRRGDAARAAARVRAAAELRRARRGPGGGRRRGSSTGCARRPAARPRPRTPRASASRVRLDDRRRWRTICSRATANLPMYRDLLAAIRAFEARRPRAAAAAARREQARHRRPRRCARFSEALYLAVTCHDYPQLWDPGGAARRRAARSSRAAVAALPPARFAPFSPAVWTSPRLRGRDRLPALARRRARPDPPVPPARAYPAVPTLVLNGDLDNITATSRRARRRVALPALDVRGDRTTRSTSRRSATATTARRRSCGASSRTLDAGDTSCAARIAEVRVVDRFPRRAAAPRPPTARAGDRSRPRARRAAAVAAATVADAIQRWKLNYGGADRGLRGGRWSYTRRPLVRFRFRRARFARDVPVSGTRDVAARHGRRPRAPHDPGPRHLPRALERSPTARHRDARRPPRRPPPARDAARALDAQGVKWGTNVTRVVRDVLALSGKPRPKGQGAQKFLSHDESNSAALALDGGKSDQTRKRSR